MGLIGGMISFFIYYSSVSLIYANHYLQMDAGVRYLGELLTRNAGISQYCVLYKDTNSRDDASNRLSNNEWGDYLVFVQLGSPITNPNTNKLECPIKNIYAIVRVDDKRSEITGNVTTSVWQYIIEVPESSGFDALETLLPSSPLGDNAIRLANCPKASDDHRMFYKINNENLLIDLEFINNYRTEFQSNTFHFIITCPTLFQ